MMPSVGLNYLMENKPGFLKQGDSPTTLTPKTQPMLKETLGVGNSYGIDFSNLDGNEVKSESLYAENAHRELNPSSEAQEVQPTNNYGIDFSNIEAPSTSTNEGVVEGESAFDKKNLIEKGIDVGLGTLETARDVIGGAVTWIPSQAARHGAIAGQTVQESLGIVPKMTAEQKAEMGEDTAHYIATLNGLIGEQKTGSGKSAMNLVGKALEPIQKAAQFVGRNVVSDNYPNVQNFISTLVEGGIFHTLPKVYKGTKVVGEKIIKIEKIQKMMDKASEGSVRKVKLQNELDSALGEVEGIVKGDPIIQDLIQRTLSDMSQKSKGFEEGKIVRPNLGPEPTTMTSPVKGAETVNIGGRPELLTGETIPKSSYQINPETGKIAKVSKVGERREFKVDQSGKPQLVEEIPNQRQVWKIGSNQLNMGIPIDLLRKTFGSVKGITLLNKLKSQVSNVDLALSGISKWLMRNKDEVIKPERLKKFMDEYSPIVEKKVVNNKAYFEEIDAYNKLVERNSEINDILKDLGERKPNEFETPYEINLAKERENVRSQMDAMDENYIHPETKFQDKGFEPAIDQEGGNTYSENHYNFEPSKPVYEGPKIHFPDNNVNHLAFARVYDSIKLKVGNAIKNVRHLHEIQSDWMNDIRKEIGIEKEIERYAKENNIKIDKNMYNRFNNKTIAQVQDILYEKFLKDKSPAIEKLIMDVDSYKFLNEQGKPRLQDSPPPLKESWYKSILRDQIVEAVRDGQEGISLSTADVHKAAWDSMGKRGFNYEPIYDVKYRKFLESELGVKAQRVGDGEGSAWYFPIKDSVREVYKKVETFEGGKTSVADLLLEPFTNKVNGKGVGSTLYSGIDPFEMVKTLFKGRKGKAAVEHTMSPEQVGKIKSVVSEAGKAKLSVEDYLKSKGVGESSVKLISDMARSLEKGKSAELETGDFSIFKEPTESNPRMNVSSDSNPKVNLLKDDVMRFLSIPIQRVGGLIKGWTTADTFFSVNRQLRPLLDRSREILKDITDEKKVMVQDIVNLRNKFNDVKLREEVGAALHARSESGKIAMDRMGVKVSENPKYAELIDEMQVRFKQAFDRINEARVKIGKRPIPEMNDYLSFFSKEDMVTKAKNFIMGEVGNKYQANLILDSLDAIKSRQESNALDSSVFHHTKRRGLDKGVKLELDPLKIYQRYMNEAIPHIRYSPLNTFIRSMLQEKITLPNGKEVVIGVHNPGMAKTLTKWNNNLVGVANIELPKGLERSLNTINNNMTSATLLGNLRTMLAQTGVAAQLFTEYDVAAVKGAVSMLSRKRVPIEKSSVLPTSLLDASMGRQKDVTAGRLKRGFETSKTVAAAPMVTVDYAFRELTWRTAWETMKKSVDKGLISEREAIRRADSAVVRINSSGAAPELSPIQMNALGRTLTLWQTFTINNLNWMGHHVLGIKNPDVSTGQAVGRVAKLAVATALINTAFEDVLGIQSPSPAPIKAMQEAVKKKDSSLAVMLAGMSEVMEAFPLGSSLKYGSHPLGAQVELYSRISKAMAGNDIYYKDVIQKAIDGDSKAQLILAELVGTVVGVPGTVQGAKFARGQMRGEGVGRSLIGKKMEDIGRGRKRKKKSYFRD